MTRVIWHSNTPPPADVTGRFAQVEFVHLALADEPPADLRADAMITLPVDTPHTATLLATTGVRWVHTIGTGVDRFPLAAVPDGVVLTCSRGASAIGISEWVLAMLLSRAKRLPESWVHEPPARWNFADLDGLHGASLGIVGLGSIGVEIARRAVPFGMHVKGNRRSVRPAPFEGVEIVATPAEAVAGADHVVIAAPATPETHHLVDAALLARMKPGVHLVNIARGALVDQDALRDALDSGHVGCASLDTVEPEPLPAGHWLYTHPRVRLSPHISWSLPSGLGTIYDTFVENLGRWLAGEPLHHVVDRSLGY